MLNLRRVFVTWLKLASSIVFKYVNAIPLAILAAKMLEYVGVFRPIPKSTFAASFIEWFGVLYGILLPLILVRAWEQLDRIDREFDREADAVKILYEDIFYLQGEYSTFGRNISILLREYVLHILQYYPIEIKSMESTTTLPNGDLAGNNILGQLKSLFRDLTDSLREAFIQFFELEVMDLTSEQARARGDTILDNIRAQYKSLILQARRNTNEPDMFILEMVKWHNNIVDIRGDRIAIASQRILQGLRLVALITSITFVVPFYFVGFTPAASFLDNILVVSVTLIVIFIFMIIEDFDEPFGGEWRITTDSWERVLRYMNEHQPELDQLTQQIPEGSVTDESSSEQDAT